MEQTNPYATPGSDLTLSEPQEEKDIKVWSFSGRLGRVRYLAYLMSLFFLVWIGGGLLAALVIPTISQQDQIFFPVVTSIIIIAIYGVLLVGSLSFAIRRIHDFNASGWWSLLLFVPLLNVLFGLSLWFIPGTDGANRFGAKTPRNGTAVSIIAALAPLILVGYIGIITAIAIPQYQTYVKRAQEQALSGQH